MAAPGIGVVCGIHYNRAVNNPFPVQNPALPHAASCNLQNYASEAMNDFRVREAVPGDAPGYIRLMKAILREVPPVDTPYAADEFDPAPGAMAERIAEYPLTGNSLFLVALDGERGTHIIGSLTCRGGSLRSDRHLADLGVYVARDWRGRSIGAALIQRALTWGAEQPVITRIQLEVLAGNDRAVRLYERSGFVREGVRRRACQRGGRAEDMILMAWLKQP